MRSVAVHVVDIGNHRKGQNAFDVIIIIASP